MEKMTNADKYLKENVSVEEMHKDYNKTGQISKSVFEWLMAKVQPTLTEDERVILRNLKTDKYILRDKEGDIILCEEEATKEEIERGLYTGYILDIFNHLFQFIKERRRILNTRIIRG